MMMTTLQQRAQNGVVLAAISVAMIATTTLVQSRDLRPSEHGLTFQNLPESSPQMGFFFGVQLPPPSPRARVGSNSSTDTDTETDTDTWWTGKKPKGSERKDRVAKGLVVATVVCGGTGVALLLAAAVLFAVHFRRRRLLASVDVNYSNDHRVNSGNSSTIVVPAPNASTIVK